MSKETVGGRKRAPSLQLGLGLNATFVTSWLGDQGKLQSLSVCTGVNVDNNKS